MDYSSSVCVKKSASDAKNLALIEYSLIEHGGSGLWHCISDYGWSYGMPARTLMGPDSLYSYTDVLMDCLYMSLFNLEVTGYLSITGVCI